MLIPQKTPRHQTNSCTQQQRSFNAFSESRAQQLAEPPAHCSPRAASAPGARYPLASQRAPLSKPRPCSEPRSWCPCSPLLAQRPASSGAGLGPCGRTPGPRQGRRGGGRSEPGQGRAPPGRCPRSAKPRAGPCPPAHSPAASAAPWPGRLAPTSCPRPAPPGPEAAAGALPVLAASATLRRVREGPAPSHLKQPRGGRFWELACHWVPAGGLEGTGPPIGGELGGPL